MKRKGWPDETGRHSLAARGVKTKQRRSKYKPAVAMEQMATLKEMPNPKEATETICGELEAAAARESNDSEEDAVALLADSDWVGTHIDQLIASFDLDDGVKTTVIGKLRKKYIADGVE
jgi:hypothetical protein